LEEGEVMADPITLPGRRLSLVIPAYNEEAGIRQAISEADSVLARITSEHEILVVDDGSSDGTAALVAEEARHRPTVRLLRHATNRGYGAALRTGFEAARFERVAFTDADCQFHLDDLSHLLSLSDECAVAAGYRVDRQDSRRRRLVSWCYNATVRLLLGTRVRDVDCALKVFRRDALTDLLPESPGYFVNTEMLARARLLGHRVAEAGVRHRPRSRGTSKVSVLRDVPRVLGALLPFWWSRVLFPTLAERQISPDPSPRSTGARGEKRLNGWALAVLLMAALLFFGRLGVPLQEPQEARFAEVARQMSAEGTWLVSGQPVADKPPLLPGLVMLSYRLFGVHDWAARLVAGAAGFATVLLTWLWGRRVLGPRAACAGALVLCLSAHFIYLGRLLSTDCLLAACVVAAWAAAHRAKMVSVHFSHGWWLLSALACGLGLLTRGPVALVLVVVPVIAFQWLDRRSAGPSGTGWILYLATALGLAAPWYIAQEIAEPGFLVDFLWQQHVARFAAPFDHEEPIWFFLPRLALGMLPWTLLLPGFLRFLGRHSARAAARRPAALGFILLALVWSLLFISASGCKRATYLLPVMPPLALALGCYLDVVLARGLAARAGSALARRGAAFACRCTQVVLVAGLAGILAAPAVGLVRWPVALLAAAVAAGALLFISRPEWRTRPRAAWGLCVAATFALLFAGVYGLLPSYARKFSLRGQVRPLAETSADGPLPIVCYPRRWDSVNFYLRRNDVQVYAAGQLPQLVEALRARPETLVFVKSGAPLEELLADLPPGLEFVPHGRQGTVTVGRVRFRPEAPAALYAQSGF
jgi:dolichol-phosphate mannosyltransferase